MRLGVSYFGNRMPDHFHQRDLGELLDVGCTFVLHTFSEYDVRFYRDSVAEMVQSSKEAGLQVYIDPWGVGGVFGGEAFSRFLLDYPECWQIRADGSRVPQACLRAPAFRSLMAEWVDTASSLRPDVLFWDEPRLLNETGVAADGSIAACYCPGCQEDYEAEYGGQMPTAPAPEIAAFQIAQAARFIQELCDVTHTHELLNAACLAPYNNPRFGLPSWAAIAAIPSLDILGATLFWHLKGEPVVPYIQRWTGEVLDLCGRNYKEAQVWLQAFLVDEGREPEIELAAQTAHEAGIRNIAAWGFKGCGHMSSLRPARPEAVWRSVRAAFSQLNP